MSDLQDLASNFIEKSVGSTAPMIRKPINPFNAMFAVEELNDQDSLSIDEILIDGSSKDRDNETIENDALHLKGITKELKAVNKQGLLLIGERIAKAREILKNYTDQSYRSWLRLTFGSFKTGYNYISFFDLYVVLPEDLQAKLKEMPAKAAYILASREAPIEKKSEVICHFYNKPAHNIIQMIQDTFDGPVKRKANRSLVVDRILMTIESEVLRLKRKKERLTEEHFLRVNELILELQSIDEGRFIGDVGPSDS